MFIYVGPVNMFIYVTPLSITATISNMSDAVSTRTLDHIVIRAADGQLNKAMQDFTDLGFTCVRRVLCVARKSINPIHVCI